MQSGVGRIIKSRSGVYLYIPSKVAGDSRFPFSPPCDVVVSIEGSRLVVTSLGSKLEEERKRNNEAYRRFKGRLKLEAGKWVVIARGRLVAVCSSYAEAAEAALSSGAEHAIVKKVGEEARGARRWRGGSLGEHVEAA